MKRLAKWWPVLLLVLAAVGVVSWLKWGPSSAESTANPSSLYTVARGDLVASVSITGEVYAPQQETLSFDVNKTQLIELDVSPGQEVKAGEVLARIDPTALQDAVDQAEANLVTAQDDLDQVQSPYSDLDLAQARLAVEQAQSNLQDAQSKLEAAKSPPSKLEIAQAKLTLAQAQEDLLAAQQDLMDAQSPASGLELAQAKLAVSQAESDLSDAKEGLAVVLDPDVADAKIAVQEAAAALESARNQLVVAQNSSDNAAKLRTLEYEAEWYKNNYWAAQVKFAQNEIDQQKLDWEYSNMLAANERLTAARAQADASIANAQNKVADSELALKTAKENLAALQSGPDELNVALAEGQVAQAEENLATAQANQAKLEAGPDDVELAQLEVKAAQAEDALSTAQDNLTALQAGADAVEISKAELAAAQAEYNLSLAQAKLDEIEAGPDPQAVEVAKAKVVKAESALQDAQAALDAATMLAPFDGTIVSVGAELDQIVSSGTAIVTLVDLSNLRIQATVDETDIAKLNIGQLADITFDAFTGVKCWGEVLEVPLQGTLSQSLLIYDVPISLEGAEDVAVKPGMTANVKIIVGRHDSVLLVPAMAVQPGDQGDVVIIADAQGNSTITPVQVGLTDGTYVEIRSGVREGDQVLVTYTLSTQGQQQFGGGGGGNSTIFGGGRAPGR